MGVPKWTPIQAREMKLKRVDKKAMNFFVRFLHNPYNPLKLMIVFKYFLRVDIFISYECNSSRPLTFVEIRLHAIFILMQYLLMFVACSTFFSMTALKKVNILEVNKAH